MVFFQARVFTLTAESVSLQDILVRNEGKVKETSALTANTGLTCSNDSVKTRANIFYRIYTQRKYRYRNGTQIPRVLCALGSN